MTDATTDSSLQARSPDYAPLTCRLRPKEMIRRQQLAPNMGEVELENCSAAPLEIEYTMTPLQFLELEVIGSGGEIVSEGHLGVTAHPLFSLKGWNKSAQGNALGPTRPKDASPERAKQGREPHDVAPFQG